MVSVTGSGRSVIDLVKSAPSQVLSGTVSSGAIIVMAAHRLLLFVVGWHTPMR